jgi:hypothetical protein
MMPVDINLRRICMKRKMGRPERKVKKKYEFLWS